MYSSTTASLRRRALVLALLGAGIIGQAAAQQAAAEAQMPAVTIVGEAEGGVFLAKRSAAATKTDTPLLEVPQSVSVVTREEMEARAVTSVLEVLRYMPGAVTETHGVDPRGYEYFNLRGFINAQITSNFLNGLRQVPGGFGHFRSEPYGLDRIDILRGNGSALFGQGDPGGTINRVAKLPGSGSGNEVRADLGSFSRRQLAADLSGSIDAAGRVQYRVIGLALDSDTQFEYGNGESGRNDRKYLAPSLLWKLSDRSSLTFLGEYTDDRSGSGRWTAVRPDGGLTHTMIGDPGFDQQENEQWSLGYLLEHQLNANWTFRQNLRHAKLRSRYSAINPGAVSNNLMARTATDYYSRLSNTLVDNQLQGNFTVDGVRHTVLAGVDWLRMEDRENRVRIPAPALNLLAPAYGVAIPARTVVFGKLQEKLTQAGVYVQDQARFANGVILTIGGRYDKSEDVLQNYLSKTGTRARDEVVSGRVGLSYMLTPNLVPYISYGTSFLPQLGQDFFGTPFEPMEAQQTEIGIKYQPAGGTTLFTAAIFDLSKTNVTTNDPLHLNFSVLSGEQQSRGVELEARGEIVRGLNLVAGYSYNDAKLSRTNTPGLLGKMPILVPQHSASAWLDYRAGGALAGLGGGGGVRYVGKNYADQVNVFQNKAQSVLDAVLHYSAGHWRYALNVANLTNKEYASCLAEPTRTCFWAPQRTVQLSARYRW